MTAGAIVQMTSITCPSRINRLVCLLNLLFSASGTDDLKATWRQDLKDS